MDFNTTGKGIAIGKVSTRNAFEVNMDTRFTGDITINEKSFLDLIYPVGSIYMSVNSTDPGSLFGGTWTNWGAGRVPVGINTSDSDFSTVEKIGGNKTHTLNVNEMPSHNHYISNGYLDNQIYGGVRVSGSGEYISGVGWETNYSGGGGAHNNLQPYITCYMWKRVS